MAAPLDGLRVLDLGQIYLGGYSGLLLSYLGAEVIKIEPPDGENVRSRNADGTPPQYQLLNASKRGLSLDLKTEGGKRALVDLVAESDVLLENFATGTMADLGLDYETLSDVNPGLIYAHGSGFGDDGPYAAYPAMDLTIQAMSGAMHTTGFEDQPPVKAGPAICDFLGAVHLVTGIVSALYARERTGSGRYLEVGMFDCMYPTLTSAIASWTAETDTPPRTGNRHSGLSIAPYNVYEVEDGYVAIICIAERHWERFAVLMDREDLIGQEGFSTKYERADRMEVVDTLVEGWLDGRTQSEVVDVLREAGIPCGPVRSIEEIVDDPHLQHRAMVNSLTNQTDGKDHVPVPGSPIKFQGVDEPEVTQAPRLGEHTEEVLREVGDYTRDEIERLRDSGAITEEQ